MKAKSKPPVKKPTLPPGALSKESDAKATAKTERKTLNRTDILDKEPTILGR